MKEPVDKKILERIKKLLAMAADVSSPNEAAIAADRAQKLMQQYNIENAASILVDLEDDTCVERFDTTDFKVSSRRPPTSIPTWASRLAVAVSRLYDCEVRATSSNVGNVQISFYGYRTDLIACQWTYQFLISQIRRFNKQARGVIGSRSQLNDFREGLVTGIIENIRQMIKAKEAVASTNTGLMVVKKNVIEKKYGEFKYGRRAVQSGSSGAFAAGQEAGRSIRINTPIGSNPDVKRLK